MSECSDLILDEDGVHAILWRFTFEAMNTKTVVNIHCDGTFFPVDWDFESAIPDTCRSPDQSFPDGVYDVTIQPIMIDNGLFNRENSNFQVLHDGLFGRFIIEDCEEGVACGRLTFSLESVTVSSDLNPATEVENTKNLISNSQAITNSAVFKFVGFFAVVSLIITVIYIRQLIQTKRGESQLREKENASVKPIIKQDYKYNDQKLRKIVELYKIEDIGAFLEFARSFDVNNDAYLSGLELREAAKKYQEVMTQAISGPQGSQSSKPRDTDVTTENS